MKNKSKIYKLGELFCGPGGFAEGARKTRVFEHVWANDIDPMACKTFQLNHPKTKVITGDINVEFIPNMKGKKKLMDWFLASLVMILVWWVKKRS